MHDQDVTLTCMFPGQGSQSKGMGAHLFERFGDWAVTADTILGYSIRELCVNDPHDELVRTEFTQPALFVVNAMKFRARADEGKPAPAFVAGHSLGEYNALHAARAFDFATGLRFVQRRGLIMSRVSGGGMAAVIGLAPERIQELLNGSEAGRRLDVANYNSFDQTVIAGPRVDIEAVQATFEQNGARAFIILNVSAPFHSRYMREAQQTFTEFLEGFDLAAPQVPVISNATARPYEAHEVRETLARQIGSSVRWLDSMLYLLDQPGAEFEEVGPGTVLAKLIGQIKRRRPVSG